MSKEPDLDVISKLLAIKNKHNVNQNKSRCKKIDELKQLRREYYEQLAKTNKIDLSAIIEIVLLSLDLHECNPVAKKKRIKQ